MPALKDKVAFVTGASSGLGGAETARLLSRQGGATVFGIARDATRLAEVFADVERGSHAVVDVTSAQACRDAIEQCVTQWGGGLDILINVAGRHQMRRTETLTDEDWADDLAVNLSGPSYLCRAALPHLLARGGNIVNVAPSPVSKARRTRPATVRPSTD